MWICNLKKTEKKEGFRKYGVVIAGHSFEKDSYEEAIKSIKQWDSSKLQQFIGFDSTGDYDLKPLYLEEIENEPETTELWDKKESSMVLVGTFDSKEEAEEKADELNIEKPLYKGRGGWRGGGRPQKLEEEKRVRFQVSCTPEEQERIKQLAKERNKTVSKLIIDSVLGNE